MKNKAKKMAKAVGIGFVALFVILMILANVGGGSEPQEVVQEQQSLGIFTLDGELGDGLDDTNINLWKSYEDRTLVVGLSSGTQVELLTREVVEDGGYEYCEVQHHNKTGWLDCDWLK